MHKTIFILVLLSCYFSVTAQKVYRDNTQLLDDEKVNPIFRNRLKEFIDSAKRAGFRPVIHEAFRSRARAVELNEQNSKIGRAAAAVSVHSFGLAVDIWLTNDSGEVFSFDPKEYKSNKENRFSYSKWMKFIRIGESFGLINAYQHGDTDHWELHPNWSKTDWISAKKIILPIYNKNPSLNELDRLKVVWKEAGL